MTEDRPRELQRHISRLRRLAGTLWVLWIFGAIGTYWLYRFVPKTVEVNSLLAACTGLLGVGVVWFIYLVYRLGELVGEDDTPT